MQIIANYRHQFLNELKSYTIHLVDNICTCTEDGTEDAVVLNWNGESVSGNLSDEVLNGVSALITKTIQDVSAAGLLLV